MAKVQVKKKACDSCGSEIRDGSTFCFNCGESVVVEPLPPAILKPDSGLFNGTNSGAKTERLPREPEPPPVSPPISPLEEPVKKDEGQKAAGPALPTVRVPRTRIQKRTEVEWVERSNSPLSFLAAAVILTVVAGLLVMAAIYLR